MHHGQTGGNEKRVKYLKILKLYEIRGKFEKLGENNNFPEIGGKF